jgi:toxin ParE1/3/4
MLPKIIWRHAANKDLFEILAYISLDNPSAAIKLINEIEAKVEKLADFPKQSKLGRIAGIREMPVRKNYMVFYQENAEEITILRVLHAARQRYQVIK